MENVSTAYHNDIYQLVIDNNENEAGKFIYSLHKDRFTPEQTEALSIFFPE